MWVTLNKSDVLTRVAGAELDAYESAALATGQVSPLDEILAGVVREVRGRVAACARNTLGDGATIPDELIHHALAIVRYRLITRLPGLGELNDETRRKEYEDAMDALKAAARCEMVIESPALVSAEKTSAAAKPATVSRTLLYGRASQEGI